MKTSIGILITAFVIMIFAGSAFAQKDNPPRKVEYHKKMFEKLNLTDAQKSKMAEMSTENQKQMIDLNAQLKKDELSLKELRLKNDINRSEVLAAVDKINQSKNKIAIAKANNKMDMYEMLTPEQRKIWKQDKRKMGNRKDFMKHRKMKNH